MSRSSVKVSIIYQMLYEVLALCLPLVTSPYVSRVLGAENIGIYSYTYSIATYFGMFSMLGVKNHGNREIAKNKDDRRKLSETFINIYSIQLSMSFLMIILYVIYIFSFAYEYKLFFTIQLLYVFSYMTDINWLFFGLELFKRTSLRNMFIKLLTFIATFMFVKDSDDLWKYCIVLAGGALLSEIILWGYIYKYINLMKPNWKGIRSNLKPMAVLFVPVLATSIYCFMDKIMVGALSTKTQLGFYENSEKITNCVKTVILSIGTVMMPRMSALAAKKDTRQAERYMRLSVEVIMMLAFAFTFGVAAVAQVFTPIYWGSEFEECGVLLQGLSLALPFSAFGNFIRTQYMIPNNKDKQYIIAVITSAIINAIMNALLIPWLGALGAVAGTVVAESGVCIIQCLFVRRDLNLETYIKKAIPYFIIGLIMFICVSIISITLSRDILALVIEVTFGMVIYSILACAYMKITCNELLEGIYKKCKKVMKK